MTREEAARILDPKTREEALLPYLHDPDGLARVETEACRIAANALRPVSREKVEKMWGGCHKCRYEDDKEPMEIYYPDGWDNGIGFEYGKAIFCPECGRPLTDEAVQMVLERLEELHENIHND